MDTIKRIEIEDAFLKSIDDTYLKTAEFLFGWFNCDLEEVKNIIKTTPNASSYRERLNTDKRPDHYEIEVMAVLAYLSCNNCVTKFKEGDLAGAFKEMAQANQCLGSALALTPSKDLQKIRQRAAARENGANGGNAKGEVLKPLWNALKIHWYEKYAHTTKSNNNVAKELMNTAIFKKFTTEENKPDQGTVGGYVSKWKNESGDLGGKSMV